jgi:ribosomal-protein-alanine acetyltransferase
MTAADLQQAMGIAASLKEAPHWPPAAYLVALDRSALPLRVALVAAEVIEKRQALDESQEDCPSGAQARVDPADFMRGLPPPRSSPSDASAAAKAQACQSQRAGTVVAGFAVSCVLGTEAELETIAVATGSQRRGLGGRLMAAMAAELRSHQVTKVHLEVRASNLAALAFYRAFGFQEKGRRPRYYRDPVEDAILLSLCFE